jgi:hypothetical protein
MFVKELTSEICVVSKVPLEKATHGERKDLERGLARSHCAVWICHKKYGIFWSEAKFLVPDWGI